MWMNFPQEGFSANKQGMRGTKKLTNGASAEGQVCSLLLESWLATVRAGPTLPNVTDDISSSENSVDSELCANKL